jgi:peptide/nickel transport system ATP-binding protein
VDIIKVKNLTISISGNKILDGVSFDLRKGGITALVGESGSGKTISALAMLRLLPATAVIENGRILFNDTDILTLPEKDLREIRGSRISMVFQEPFLSLNPVMKIGSQVEEAFVAHADISAKARKKKVLDLFSRLRLPRGIVNLYPHEISGGMRQRVLIASAIAFNPEVLILDEPTTALDVSVQKDILGEIKRIKEEKGLTVFFISHDFSVVNMMADNIAVMKNGKILEFGEKERVMKNPGNLYTKRLIECIPRLGDIRDRLPEYKETT